MPMDDKGMYDWDEESRKYQTVWKTREINYTINQFDEYFFIYHQVIKYSCPKAGWGYPSNGASEIYSICQADKSWNVTFVEECICKYSNCIFESFQGIFEKYKYDFLKNYLIFHPL